MILADYIVYIYNIKNHTFHSKTTSWLSIEDLTLTSVGKEQSRYSHFVGSHIFLGFRHVSLLETTVALPLLSELGEHRNYLA